MFDQKRDNNSEDSSRDSPSNEVNNQNLFINEYEDNKIKNKHCNVKSKKYHKSKNGCTACKERKIKCDQKLPFCMNCLKRGIDCPYLTMTPYQIHLIMESQKGEMENNINNINEYPYKITNSINLNNDTSQINKSIYPTHEIENIMLSSSINKVISTNETINNDYIPLRTNFIPNEEEIKILNSNTRSIPLYSNSKISNKTFNTSHKIIINYLEKFSSKYLLITTYLFKRDFNKLFSLLNGIHIEIVLFINHVTSLSISQLFNKLLRKSFLLFSTDYYKNIILKQKILPNINYMAKLSISCECENESVISIDEITRIIKDEYLINFNEFSIGCKNLFISCFIVLDDCLGYHFKNGLKYEMNFEDGEKSINLVGIFSTGIYAMIMERSNEKELMTNSNFLSSYLVFSFKELLIQNYSINLFSEFKNVIDKLSFFYHSDINYENLRSFCEKHENLLRVNLQNNSILGFNNGYLIRLLNSFKSILPFDLSNILSTNNEFSNKLSETEILIRIAYYTLYQIINIIIPGIKNITAGYYSTTEWTLYNINNINNLMKLFSKIKNTKLQLSGIFLIRIGRYCKCNWVYYKKYLNNIILDKILDEEEDISIHQRYLRLKDLKDNNSINEIQIRTFSLDKGQFFREWNYPNKANLKPERSFKVSNNKIMNYFENNENLLIEDFINSNNGFFSLDHNITEVINSIVPVATEIKYTDKEKIKILWKLVTYIRINNL